MCLHQKKLYLLLRARSSTLNAKFGNAVTSVRWEREREREREFIGTNIKQFHANIKSWRWDTDKKPANQVVSSGAPRNFHKFLSLFKVDGRICANLIMLYFLKRLQSAGCSTQLRGSAGSQPPSIVVCSVPQEAEDGRESVNRTKMKLLNSFASKQTTVAL